MSTLNIRIDESTKKAAKKVFADLGIDVSSGVKMFLHQVITEQGLPFTPTKNAKAIKERWDAEVKDALKNGKVYATAKEALKDF